MSALLKLNNNTAKTAGSPSDYLTVHSNLFNPVVDVVNNLTGNGTAQAITGTTGTFSSTLSVTGAVTMASTLASGSQTITGTMSVSGVSTLTGGLTSPAGAQFYSATAVPAGGTAGLGIKFSSTSNLGVFFGSGVPTLAAAQGSLYVRTDGSSTSTRLYINTNGSTTWTNVTTAA